MEYIFLRTDPSFEIATRAVAELRRTERIQVTYSKRSFIDRVKSASENNNLRFGSLYDFARRIGVSARVCMADSAGMNPRVWRLDNFYDRNLDLDSNNFHSEVTLGDGFNRADVHNQERYCSEYDRFYPHFVIENIMRPVENERGVTNHHFNRYMLIFRNDFNELVEINTTMHVKDNGNEFENDDNDNGRYECMIAVVTVKAKITPGTNLKFMRFLTTLCNANNENANDIANNLQRMNLNQGNEDELAQQIVDVVVNTE